QVRTGAVPRQSGEGEDDEKIKNRFTQSRFRAFDDGQGAGNDDRSDETEHPGAQIVRKQPPTDKNRAGIGGSVDPRRGIKSRSKDELTHSQQKGIEGGPRQKRMAGVNEHSAPRDKVFSG